MSSSNNPTGRGRSPTQPPPSNTRPYRIPHSESPTPLSQKPYRHFTASGSVTPDRDEYYSSQRRWRKIPRRKYNPDPDLVIRPEFFSEHNNHGHLHAASRVTPDSVSPSRRRASWSWQAAQVRNEGPRRANTNIEMMREAWRKKYGSERDRERAQSAGPARMPQALTGAMAELAGLEIGPSRMDLQPRRASETPTITTPPTKRIETESLLDIQDPEPLSMKMPPAIPTRRSDSEPLQRSQRMDMPPAIPTPPRAEPLQKSLSMTMPPPPIHHRRLSNLNPRAPEFSPTQGGTPIMSPVESKRRGYFDVSRDDSDFFSSPTGVESPQSLQSVQSSGSGGGVKLPLFDPEFTPTTVRTLRPAPQESTMGVWMPAPSRRASSAFVEEKKEEDRSLIDFD